MISLYVLLQNVHGIISLESCFETMSTVCHINKCIITKINILELNINKYKKKLLNFV